MSNLFQVPDHALTAWLHLHEQIIEAGGTPCAGPNRDDWIGGVTQQKRAAEACLDCPVMTACGAYAATAGEPHGVWGGRTATERVPRKPRKSGKRKPAGRKPGKTTSTAAGARTTAGGGAS